MSRLIHSTDPVGNPACSIDLNSRSLLGPSLQPIHREILVNKCKVRTMIHLPTITFIPDSTRPLTVNHPIPRFPPVMTAYSFSLFKGSAFKRKIKMLI